ncbi:MAG: SAM-dependent chlorinase/fluorinase [Candidatus Aminicenantes bacterium]|nr:SAM-dependent chlorinase/fluorinase [Candidatus Aminicenantes bacterium]
MTIGMITDFGENDYFVGTLKGVIKKINPQADIIDICHGVPSYFIQGGSYVLEKTFRFFPAGTIFLVVVDPGVGTKRKLLLVTAAGFSFVAPDNGILTPIFDLGKDMLVREIDQERYFLISGSSTFEARDRMAPVAAYLSKGTAAADIGSPTDEFVVNTDYHPQLVSPNQIEGRIIHVDKFGNLISNVSGKWLFEKLLACGCQHFKLRINDQEISEYRQNYASTSGLPFLLIGSHGNLEIAMNRRQAFRELKAQLNQKFMILLS